MTETTDTISLQAVTVAEDQTPRRAGLMHAFAEAEQIVSQLHAVPTDVTVKGDSVTGVYSVDLFYSRSTQGVLEFAQVFDAEVASSPSIHTAGVYLKAYTRFHGVDVQAWTVAAQAPDPDGARERGVDEDPITFTLTPEAEGLLTASRADTLREAAQAVRDVRNAGALVPVPVDQLLDQEADAAEAEGQ